MKKYIDRSLRIDQYTGLLDSLSAEGKTTGTDQSESRINYGRLNIARMRRLDKTVELESSVRSEIGSVNVDWVWLIITEGWCGDAAQNIPVIEKIAAANPGIETRYVLRDENPELMDQFLTNGTRSIPKLIAIDRSTGRVLGTWGPRPKVVQDLFTEQRSQGIEKSVILENVQRWYLADRGRSLQKELAELTRQWLRSPLAKAA